MKLKALGVMIGSSLDGIDLVECQFEFKDKVLESWQMLEYKEMPLQANIVKRVKNYRDLSFLEMQQLGIDISKNIYECCQEIYKDRFGDFNFIAVHGITIIHEPNNLISVQLVDANYLSHVMKIPVISDFRRADILEGGQGAPMVPIVERYLFKGYQHFMNLGGIANVSSHYNDTVVALDVCPFNQVLNFFSMKEGKNFDDSGKMAKSGKIIEEALVALNKLNYFKLEGPKSLSNQWVQEVCIPTLNAFEISPIDALATYVEFCVEIIDDYFEHSSLDQRLLVTGGGALNTFFIENMRNRLKKKNIELVIPEDSIVRSKEAILMALAGALRIQNIANFIPSATGAKRAVSGGMIFEA